MYEALGSKEGREKKKKHRKTKQSPLSNCYKFLI
jgi:hypothetical protein